MKKIIFMGASKAGKTTLTKALLKEDDEVLKTQAVQYQDFIIDTPGEYIENRGFYAALIQSAVEAELIGLVFAANAEQYYLPPSFAATFPKEILGIITKVDLASKSEIKRAKRVLKQAGAKKIFQTSAKEGIGVDKLRNYLLKKGKGD